mgnify:CR=1 FL=1
MTSILNGKPVPLEDVFNDSVFILMNVSRHPVYENNKRTDDYDGQVYEVCDTMDFKRIKVKILGQMKPIIENDALQERRKAGKPVFVEIIGGTVSMYEIRDKNGTINDRFAKCERNQTGGCSIVTKKQTGRIVLPVHKKKETRYHGK